IVNPASMAGMINGMGFSPYSATKFAVVSMLEGLAVQLKPLGVGVSVLCPSFVRTGIGESGRNRPQRYGPAQALDPASPAAAIVAEIARRLQDGLDPAAVAARVLDAIQNDELYVFTHPNMREGVDERFAAILGHRWQVNMDELKRQAAGRALDMVRDGMKLGLGTGSPAKHFVELLGERVRGGLKIIGVPTSEATRTDAVRCGIPLTSLDDIDRLDLTVDGAD